MGPGPCGLVAQRRTDVAQAVNLPVARLTDPATDRDEVVTVDRRAARGDGAGRPLRVVVGVSGHAVLGRDRRRRHLQEVELRRHLEQRAGVRRVAMQRGDVSDDLGDL